ncbi:MAG TPA: TlyA family rRNA (cytidine-2'-O)-methyltransferase [Coriobacteriia bacterium]|nr:TlyA family rRNA (cytidine-2'-O)-methyltransferase [Coriobacteriia bacterium]
MSSGRKIRLVDLLVERGLCDDAALAKRLVIAGEVRGENGVLTQPSLLLDPGIEITLTGTSRFVSRGGDKLYGALEDFAFDVSGLKCLDVGASTGGFTDCLLKAGATGVVAVDVAYGQFAWQLRNDARITLLERTSIRAVDPTEVGAPFDLVVADVSFSPLRSLFPVLAGFVEAGGFLITLIKPQFELPAGAVGKNGVVSDSELHEKAIIQVLEAATANDLAPIALTYSGLKGPKGNREFFLMAQRSGIPANITVEQVVRDAHRALV